MAKREKKVLITDVTSEQVEQAFADYAKADAQEEQLKAKIDIALTKIREQYASELTALALKKEESFTILQAFAVEQKETLFTKTKSLKMIHGIIGFRTGTPKLKPLKGFTWDAVTNLLEAFLPTYVRTTTEAAKDKLLADRDLEEVSSLFTKCGISVIQDETFFVEPKKEQVTSNI